MNQLATKEAAMAKKAPLVKVERASAMPDPQSNGGVFALLVLACGHIKRKTTSVHVPAPKRTHCEECARRKRIG
jgi:hypothetical protein